MGSHISETRAILDGLRRIVQSLRAAEPPGPSGTRLPPAQLFVLSQLQRCPGSSINELAALTYTHQSSVSGVVDKLCKGGLATRRTAATDRRRQQIFLTAQGRARLRRAPLTPQGKLVSALEELPSPVRRGLSTGLQGLVSQLKLSSAPPAMFFEEAPKRHAKSR